MIDAGPIIHLHELGALELLFHLGEIFVPRKVAEEAEHHRPGVTAQIQGHIVGEADTMSTRLHKITRLHDLHAGEVAALAWVEKFGADLFVSDDKAARAAADDMHYESTGTLGVILEAADSGKISNSAATRLVKSVRTESTLHASTGLLRKVIAKLR